MNDINSIIYRMPENTQVPSVGWFIDEARDAFRDMRAGNFYISSVPMVTLPLDEYYSVPRMFANGYKELGLWIPAFDYNEGFSGLLLTWADDTYPTPQTVQYAYLAETGHFVMVREVTPFSHIKNMSPAELITQFVV